MHVFVSPKTPQNFERRRRWMIWIVYTVAFMIGSENAIIYPTAWKYLQELGIRDENVLGLVISAFNIGALISGVSLGIMADKWGKSRWIVLWFNVLSVIGNFMYFIGGSQWMLVSGRFIAGIGGGIGSVVLAEMAKATRVSERAKVMAIAFGARQLGLAFGPVYNLVMGKTSFSLGFVYVSDTNFPGFFMVLVWTAYEFLFFISYFDAGVEMQAIIDEEKRQQLPKTYLSIADPRDPPKSPAMQDVLRQHSPFGASSERQPLLGPRDLANGHTGRHDTDDAEKSAHNVNGKGLTENGHSQQKSAHHPATKKNSQDGEVSFSQRSLGLARTYINYFLTDTVVPLLFVQFLAFFIQNMLETTIPPATQFYFGYGPRVNSFIYLAIGMEAIFVYIFFYFMVRRVSERVMLAGSCGMMVIGCTLGLVINSRLEEGNPGHFPLYMAGCAVVFLAVPLASITTMTIFSKALPREVQGFAQGIRRVCNYLGLIMGPLYGGGLAYQGLVLYSLPLSMTVVALILVVASYSRYKYFLER